MRKDLYMDIQSIIQDAFISCAIFRKRHSDKQLYLFQLGTDQLENLFSTLRTINHSFTCDFLEMNERLKMAYDVENVYAKRPDLRPTSRLTAQMKIKSTLDHSSVHSWSGDLLTYNLDLETIWSYGRDKALSLLKNYDYNDNEFIVGEEYTMMNPISEYEDNDEDDCDDENNNNDNNEINETVVQNNNCNNEDL